MKQKPTYQELEKELKEIRITNQLIEKSPIIKFLWKNKENWPVEYVSDNVKNIFGYTADDFITGKILYSEIIYPEDLQKVKNEVSSQSKIGFYSIEHEPYRIITKAGEIKWVNDITHIRRNENNEITHFEGIIIESIKLKETEEALIKSETNLRALFHTMIDVVFELDCDGRFTNIAPTSPELLFKPPEEVMGKTLHEVFPKPEADKFLNFVRRCLDENKTISIDYSLTIENKTIWFEGRATPKTKSTVLFIAHDITKRKQAENALNESEEKLRESNKTKDKFISIIAHDLRSPFNSTLGFSKILNEQFDEYNTEEKIYRDYLRRFTKQF